MCGKLESRRKFRSPLGRGNPRDVFTPQERLGHAAEVCDAPHRLDGIEECLSALRDHESRAVVIPSPTGGERRVDFTDGRRGYALCRRIRSPVENQIRKEMPPDSGKLLVGTGQSGLLSPIQ